MVKYHIGEDGRPAKCRAKIKPCPKGENSPHFESIEKCQEYIDKYYEENNIKGRKKFRQVSVNTVENELKNKKSRTNRILELSNRKSVGWNYEVFMANNYALSKGLKNAIIRDETTGRWNTKALTESGLSKEEAQKVYNNAKRALKSAYGDIDPKTAIKVIYFDNPESGNIFVQTGASQTMDGISATKSDFRVVEIKRTHNNGAQLEEKLVSIGSNGEYNIQDGRITDAVYEAVNNRTTYDNDKDSDILKISHIESLRQFTRDYQSRGADELVFTDKEGKPYVIDMTQSEDKCIEDLSNAGLTAQIKVRTNQSTSNMDNASYARLKNNYNNLYSGTLDKDGNLTIGQINKDKIKVTGKQKKYIRFGEFKTDITEEEWKKLPPDTVIESKRLKYFRPILSGDIKIREGATPISQMW